MPRPARVLPDDYNPYAEDQVRLRREYRVSLKEGDTPTTEENEANSNWQAWRRGNPDAPAPSTVATPATPAPPTPQAAAQKKPAARPSKPKTSAPKPRPVSEVAPESAEAEIEVAAAVQGVGPSAAPDLAYIASTIDLDRGDGRPYPDDEPTAHADTFALEQPPIDDAPVKVSEPTLQEQLDTARLELIECERANRHQQGDLRAEISTLKKRADQDADEMAALQRQVSDRDKTIQALTRENAAQHKETTRISDQAAIADETIRQLELDLERERLDHRAYVDLATAKPADPTLPEMEGGTWAKAYIFRPDEIPDEPPCTHSEPAGMPTFVSPEFGYLTVTRPRSLSRRAIAKKRTR